MVELKRKEKERYNDYVIRMTDEEKLNTSIKYVCDYLDVSKEWFNKNIKPNVNYCLLTSLRTPKGQSIYDYADDTKFFDGEELDKSRVFVNLNEVKEHIIKNSTFSARTIPIELRWLFDNEEPASVLKKYVSKKYEAGDLDFIRECIAACLQPAPFKYIAMYADDSRIEEIEDPSPSLKKRTEIEETLINDEHLNLILEYLNDVKFYPSKKLDKTNEIAQRIVFGHGFVKVKYQGNGKTWFIDPEEIWFNSKIEDEVILKYSDYFNLREKGIIKRGWK